MKRITLFPLNSAARQSICGTSGRSRTAHSAAGAVGARTIWKMNCGGSCAPAVYRSIRRGRRLRGIGLQPTNGIVGSAPDDSRGRLSARWPAGEQADQLARIEAGTLFAPINLGARAHFGPEMAQCPSNRIARFERLLSAVHAWGVPIPAAGSAAFGNSVRMVLYPAQVAQIKTASLYGPRIVPKAGAGSPFPPE